jgi:hypothetical protein
VNLDYLQYDDFLQAAVPNIKQLKKYITVTAIGDVWVALVTVGALAEMPISNPNTNFLAKAVPTEAGRRPIAVTCRAVDDPV